MRADIIPAIFPIYELSDHTGTRRKLSDLQGQHPMVLVLVEAGSVPRIGASLELLVELHRELEVSYCRLVTISTDSIAETNEFRTGVGAHWTFLSDAGRKIQKDLDIAEYTDPTHNPMILTLFVLEPGLRVFKIYNGYWFLGRPTNEELRRLPASRDDEVSSQYWDITDAAHKEAWARGEKDLFYPYGKHYTAVFGEQD